MKSGEMQEAVIEALGDLMHDFWKKYDVLLDPETSKAYGYQD